MILDATAGNRMMWPNKYPPNTIFLDKQIKLVRPPDIFASNEYCPFRDDIFDCVIYDPPHVAKVSPAKTGKFRNPEHPSYYGWDISKKDLLINLHKAQKEFQRLTKRLCFKWSYNPTMGGGKNHLWKVLPFFLHDWKIINKWEKKKRNTTTWWITFVRSID